MAEWVYRFSVDFECPNCREVTTYSKVGWTRGKPYSRKKSLQTGCPLPLREAGAVRGSAGEERVVHAMLAGRESGGGEEWFVDTDPVEDLFNGHAQAERLWMGGAWPVEGPAVTVVNARGRAPEGTNGWGFAPAHTFEFDYAEPSPNEVITLAWMADACERDEDWRWKALWTAIAIQHLGSPDSPLLERERADLRLRCTKSESLLLVAYRALGTEKIWDPEGGQCVPPPAYFSPPRDYTWSVAEYVHDFALAWVAQWSLGKAR